MVYYCNICSGEEIDEFHKNSSLHRFNYMLDRYQANKSSLRSSRHGVELKIEVKQVNGFRYDFTTEPSNKGNHYLNITPDKFRSHGNQIEFWCHLKNARTKKDDPIIVTYAGVLHPFKPYSMIYPNSTDEKQFVKIEGGLTYSLMVKLTLEENNVSNFKIPIYFSIQTLNQNQEKMMSFSLARSIVVAIHEKILEDVVIEKSPFTSNKWEKVHVVQPRKQTWMVPDQFPIPKKYWNVLLTGLKKDFGDGVLQEILQKLEPGYVTEKNYKDFFHILLWLEEVCCILGLSSYNMENVHMVYLSGDVLQLEVPGLAEKRPSVVKGDFIEIKIHGDHTSYKGIIQRVDDKSVNIDALDSVIINMVRNHPGIEIDVRFVLGRIHFERMHQGVEQVVENGFVSQLFPSEQLLSRRIFEPITLSQNELFNTKVYNNSEQMTAVLKIVNNTSKGAPYIVDGPPGTGKTVTIVEAIYHLMKRTKHRILVCAPANAACNMLTEKLAAFCDTSELKRIMSENCDTASVHKDIVKYCNLVRDDDGVNIVVPFQKGNLNNYRIIVTTLVFAGKYTRMYHPDVVFLDEAAQAREPEACCAIGLLGASKQLVLAGDFKQLGPVVHSEICMEYNYHISLLERLMQLPLYKNDVHNNFTTMLKLNFRSHEEILRLPNQLFYDSQLQAVSAAARNDPLAKTYVYKLIVNGGDYNQFGGSPVEFCSVLALERREGRSPSYYNPREVLLVQKFVQALTSQILGVTPSEIGVVTPYIRQMYKIREALRDFPEVEIGTTEAFQGREKRVMIISTVRAQEDLLLHDKKYKLGFVSEPQRFNVAITRAKSKLIVIGNPLVLSKDAKWLQLINQAKILGTRCGAPYPERKQDVIDDISKRFGMFHLNDIKHKQG